MTNDELIKRYIEPNPWKPQAEEAWLIESAIPVWSLIGDWKANGRNAARVAQDFEISEEEVRAALAYYRRHKCAIDTRLAANAA
jgi:uncharacterized protein (DUF433 family)